MTQYLIDGFLLPVEAMSQIPHTKFVSHASANAIYGYQITESEIPAIEKLLNICVEKSSKIGNQLLVFDEMATIEAFEKNEIFAHIVQRYASFLGKKIILHSSVEKMQKTSDTSILHIYPDSPGERKIRDVGLDSVFGMDCNVVWELLASRKRGIHLNSGCLTVAEIHGEKHESLYILFAITQIVDIIDTPMFENVFMALLNRWFEKVFGLEKVHEFLEFYEKRRKDFFAEYSNENK